MSDTTVEIPEMLDGLRAAAKEGWELYGGRWGGCKWCRWANLITGECTANRWQECPEVNEAVIVMLGEFS